MRVALSVGCPCGIGPEVAVAACARGVHPGTIALVGDVGAIGDAARLRGIDLTRLAHVDVVPVTDLAPDHRRAGQPGPDAGRAQLAAVDAALDLVLRGDADALVTGPVSKAAIRAGGATEFTGHTEHLQARTASDHVVMLFAGPTLRVALVTTHLRLGDVPAAVTASLVARTVDMLAAALTRDFAVPRPRVVVCGLNPHAGEGGLFGLEDRDAIAPGIAAAREALGAGVSVVGPVPAETAFRAARDGRYDAVVAMYHDQATIASKLLDFGAAVNVTLGLPLVRTSVDHGTGYDIAGRGVADPEGMSAALALGFAMAARRPRR